MFFKSLSRRSKITCASTTVGAIAASAALALCMPVTASADSSVDASVDASPMTYQAIIDKRLTQADQSISRASLIYNDHGYRLVPLAEDNEFELIVNTDNDRVWIIDRNREITTEIDLAHEVSAGPQLITLAHIRRLVRLPGQLDAKPCQINGGHKTGSLVVDGLDVEKWTCNEESHSALSGFNDQVTEQHYSPHHGRVVYSLFAEDFEFYLQDIQVVKSELLFAKPEDFRKASAEEFLGITQPIGAYTLSDSSQQFGKADNVNP